MEDEAAGKRVYVGAEAAIEIEKPKVVVFCDAVKTIYDKLSDLNPNLRVTVWKAVSELLAEGP